MAIVRETLDPNAATYADLNDLDPIAAAKLAAIEDGATADQSGDEIVAAINVGSNSITRESALSQDDLNLIKTAPVAGEFKVKTIQRDATGQYAFDYDNVAV